MSTIKVTEDTVEMTVTFRKKFSGPVEMCAAVEAAADLRAMVAAEVVQDEAENVSDQLGGVA